MEIIKNITEVSNVYFGNEWDTYDGYCIETDSRQLYFVISNGQCCCENWGYLSSEDDFGSFIGSELKNVYVTETRGLLQFAAYNEHNGYYGHGVRLISKYDDKTIINVDEVL